METEPWLDDGRNTTKAGEATNWFAAHPEAGEKDAVTGALLPCCFLKDREGPVISRGCWMHEGLCPTAETFVRPQPPRPCHRAAPSLLLTRHLSRQQLQPTPRQWHHKLWGVTTPNISSSLAKTTPCQCPPACWAREGTAGTHHRSVAGQGGGWFVHTRTLCLCERSPQAANEHDLASKGITAAQRGEQGMEGTLGIRKQGGAGKTCITLIYATFRSRTVSF